MEDKQTKIIASVIVGKRWSSIHGEEVPVRNVVQEYFNRQVGRTQWRIIFGLCEDGSNSGFNRFNSREEALEALKAFGALRATRETLNREK